MSNDKTEVIPTVPTRRSILRLAASASAERSPFSDWRDQVPTEEMPAVSSQPDPARPREHSPRRPDGLSPRARRRARHASAVARHLRAALAGALISAAILTGLQLYAAAGISQARQAALAERDARAAAAQTEQTAPTSPAQTEQTEQGAPAHTTTPTGWAVEGTTTAAPSPLDLPRCTTSPDTPLPCLATISPDSRRAVVLEEDASLTALVLQ